MIFLLFCSSHFFMEISQVVRSKENHSTYKHMLAIWVSQLVCYSLNNKKRRKKTTQKAIFLCNENTCYFNQYSSIKTQTKTSNSSDFHRIFILLLLAGRLAVQSCLWKCSSRKLLLNFFQTCICILYLNSSQTKLHEPQRTNECI